MKKLLISLVSILLASVGLNAGVIATNLTTGTNALYLSTGGYVVSSISVVTGDTNTIFRVYDYASTNLTYTNAAYTNMTRYTTNVVQTYTNVNGVTNSFTNTMMYVDVTVTAATTNTYSPIITYAAASGTVTTFTDKLVLAKGLVISNDCPATVIVTYSSQ